MKLIVCLGNPGKEYENTRHNVGFLIASYLKGVWAQSSDFIENGREKDHLYDTFEFEWCNHELGVSEKIVLLLPQTFMNLSGKAVLRYLKYTNNFNIEKDLWVIHDDIDIVLGRMKIAKNASAAGHNGVKDIIAQLGTKDFTRFRIGIRPKEGKPDTTEDFVLKNFSKDEKKIIADIFLEVAAAIPLLLIDDLQKAQAVDNPKHTC